MEFLEITSTLIRNFSSHQPYSSMADPRFNENEQCLKLLGAWRKTVSNRKDLQASDRNKMFLSEKTMFDVSSTIIGFREFCKQAFKNHPGICVVSHCINSNIVENVFCQQRGLNGQNDNPTYAQYGSTINSILLGQTAITNKSNTGSVESLSFYKPSKLPVIRKKNMR